MAAEKTLSKINMDEWRWIIQGQIEGRKRDYTSGLLAAERRGIVPCPKAGEMGERRRCLCTSTPR